MNEYLPRQIRYERHDDCAQRGSRYEVECDTRFGTHRFRFNHLLFVLDSGFEATTLPNSAGL